MLFPLLFINLVVISKSYQIGAASSNNKNVTTCLRKIVKDFYDYGTKVTYIDINFTNSEEILKAITSLYHVSALTCMACENVQINDSYIITAGSPADFLSEFNNIQRQRWWRPDRRYLVIVDNLTLSDLQSILNVTLRLSIVDVIIIDNTYDPMLYTYNPFENYGCGSRFDRIIEKGKCLGEIKDIFYYKYETGLENCIFTANSAHWPPFSIDQGLDKGSDGIEDKIVSILSEREHFTTIHYNYSNDAENFSMVSENLSAVGPLTVIQENQDHMMFGGMLLTNSRARAFDFIWMHLANLDDVRILVKAATEVDSWRNSYLEFSLWVWVGLVSVILVYYILVLLLLPSKDKTRIFFEMFDYFFQHGSKITGNFRFKVVFLFWIWFAYLISSLYHSSLVGLITNPSRNYQISTYDDIVKYNLKPCISPVVTNYFSSVHEDLMTAANESNDQCNGLLKSIHSVSKSNDLYTVAMCSVYSYYKYNFYNQWGTSEIYAFKHPMNNVLYAIYLHKGFPFVDRLQTLSLRLRENGLIIYYIENIMSRQRLKFQFDKERKKFNVIVPWYLLLSGSIISTIVFIVEINKNKISNLRRQREKFLY